MDTRQQARDPQQHPLSWAGLPWWLRRLIIVLAVWYAIVFVVLVVSDALN
jgi:hypothetical protein